MADTMAAMARLVPLRRMPSDAAPRRFWWCDLFSMLMSFWRLSDNIYTIYTIYTIYIYIYTRKNIYQQRDERRHPKMVCWMVDVSHFFSEPLIWRPKLSSAAKMRAPRRFITEYVVSSISSRIMNDARFEDKTVKIAIPNLRWQSYRFCKDAIFHHFSMKKISVVPGRTQYSTKQHAPRRGLTIATARRGRADSFAQAIFAIVKSV